MLALVFIIIFVPVVYFFYVLHKFRKFPSGPYGIPFLGYLPFMGMAPHKQYGEIAKKYGKIFTICFGSLPIVVLNDLESIKKAYKNDVFSGRPKSVLAISMINGGLTFNEGRAWFEQRKFTLRALRELGFGKSSLDEMIRQDVGSFVTFLKTQLGGPVSFKHVFEIAVINTFWSIVASEKHAYNDPEILYLHKLSYEAFIEPKVAGPLWFMPWLAKLAPKQTGYANLLRGVTNLRKFYRTLIDRRMAQFNPDDLHDLIDHYLKEIQNTTDPNSSFFGDNGIYNLGDLLINLFSAASDTASSALCFSFLYLLNYPEVLTKVRHEIDTIVGAKELPKNSDREKMPYTEATMTEVLRIASITPGGLLHSTLEDVEFEGYSLPKGTIISANLYQVLHDSEYWGDPEIFRPERFIGPDGNFRKDEGMLIFSTGKRMCPAEHMGMSTIFLNLTAILQNFNVDFNPEEPPPSFEAKPGLILDTQPYTVILRERSVAERTA